MQPTWQRVGATPESVPTYELNPAHFLPNACSSGTRVLVCQHEGCGFDSRLGLWTVTPSLTNLGSSAVNFLPNKVRKKFYARIEAKRGLGIETKQGQGIEAKRG